MLLIVKDLKQFLKVVLIAGFMLLPQVSFANPTAIMQAKSKLKHLIEKINTLQHTLNNAHDKNKLLNHELATIEKQISLKVQEIHNTQLSIKETQAKITVLQEETNQLNNQLHQQQLLLVKHIRARYMMGEYQPLKWLLNQDTPYATNRLLTFHQYVIMSREKNINQLHKTKTSITQNELQLHKELDRQIQLAEKFNLEQKTLEQDKHYRITIIHALNHDIENKKEALNEFQNNKDNLSQLLKSLSLQNTLQNQRPFFYARTKLPHPVKTDQNNIQKINQGLLFIANEGATVTAVYPGKVVFSDWLKGYGLLLIIDHGRGFMTLYAHNQSLFKQKGDPVDQGEQIAMVGHSGGIKQNGLYFEIRQRGKAISALPWLS